jgi:steroid 5-alpha reductase family enzyme
MFLLSAGSGAWYLSLLSPLLITYLLLKVSGVTMLEKRYEGNDAYALYKKNTSALFPLPPKKYGGG